MPVVSTILNLLLTLRSLFLALTSPENLFQMPARQNTLQASHIQQIKTLNSLSFSSYPQIFQPLLFPKVLEVPPGTSYLSQNIGAILDFFPLQPITKMVWFYPSPSSSSSRLPPPYYHYLSSDPLHDWSLCFWSVYLKSIFQNATSDLS